MNARMLAPGKHSRKAIYGAASAFVTALVAAAANGSISFAEGCTIAGAPILGYLAVWAGVNEPPKPGSGQRRAT